MRTVLKYVPVQCHRLTYCKKEKFISQINLYDTNIYDKKFKVKCHPQNILYLNYGI